MFRIKLWFRGWFFYWRAIYKSRVKKHGAGRQPWQQCFAVARSARWIVYGQHYGKWGRLRKQRN